MTSFRNYSCLYLCLFFSKNLDSSICIRLLNRSFCSVSLVRYPACEYNWNINDCRNSVLCCFRARFDRCRFLDDLHGHPPFCYVLQTLNSNGYCAYSSFLPHDAYKVFQKGECPTCIDTPSLKFSRRIPWVQDLAICPRNHA